MDKKIRVAINGFGRIGRGFYKAARNIPEIEIVAVNDLGDVENMAYLLKYDTTYGRSDFEVAVIPPGGAEEPGFVIEGKKIVLVQEKEPLNLPWAKYNIDIVVESTGFFTAFDKSEAHLKAGAKRVVITAPVKGGVANGARGKTVLMGINDEELRDCEISSNGSCTTNSIACIVDVLNREVGVSKALLNTTHAYTATQALIDGPVKKDLRGGRAAAMNLVPSSTGAAIAVTEVVTSLKGSFDGISIRVPVVAGSIADVTFLAKRPTTVEEINRILKEAAKNPRYAGIFTTTDEPLVSSDIIGQPYGGILDLAMTRVSGGDLVKIMSWYDNEAGFTNTLVLHVRKVAQILQGK